MNKMHSFLKKLHLLFYVLLLLQTGAIGYLGYELTRSNTKIKMLAEEADFRSDMLYNEIDNQNAWLKPTLMPEQNRLAIPELRISLPYNAVTATLRYTFDDTYLRVGSTLVTDHALRQMSCSELVLVTLGDGAALNPWTESAGSVTLSDNSTLSLIKSIAFENNEASTLACASDAWIFITPEQIVEEFKTALKY